MEMLRHLLDAAIRKTNPLERNWIQTQHWSTMSPDNMWRGAVERACFNIMVRGQSGPHVDYVLRAARQIEQSGSVQFDDPETPEDKALEEPWLITVRKLERANRLARGEGPEYQYFQMTPEHLAKISEPTYIPRLTKFQIGMIRWMENPGTRFSLSKIKDDESFSIMDFGIDFWNGGIIRRIQIVNGLLKNGMFALDAKHGHLGWLTKGVNFDKIRNLVKSLGEPVREDS